MVGTQSGHARVSTHAPDRLAVAHFTLTDAGGGAAGAVARLHRALLAHDVDSRLLVARKRTTDPATHAVVNGALAAQSFAWSRRLDLLPRWLGHPRADVYWSPGWHSLRDLTAWPSVTSADVLALYWLPRGFMGIRQVGRLLSLGKPVVWRLSDMWPFTGGCHYSRGCEAFTNGCGECPQLRSRRVNDLSRRLHNLKRKQWSGGDLTVVSPSRWMAETARRSPVFAGRDIRVIATGVDTSIFRPIDRSEARRACGLPADIPLVLFGADAPLHDARKGGSSVVSVMNRIPAALRSGLVLFGTSSRPEGIPESVPVFPMGTVSGESAMANLYSACDVFLAPSRQENLANTVLEAMACGTPVVAFALGGMAEAIEPGRTGFLGRAPNDFELADATSTLLNDSALRAGMSTQARGRALSLFDLRVQAGKYVDLYREKLGARFS